MKTKILYTPYWIKNKFSFFCFILVTFFTCAIYAYYNDLAFLDSIYILLVLFLLEGGTILLFWFKNRKKNNFVMIDNEKIIIVKNNRKVEYSIDQAELITVIPNCFEIIRFNQNFSFESIYFRSDDFDKIKWKIVSKKSGSYEK